MFDLHDRTPMLHWYESKQNVEGQYVIVMRLGRWFAGFVSEPDYYVIDRYNLKEIGVGDMRYIEELRV